MNETYLHLTRYTLIMKRDHMVLQLIFTTSDYLPKILKISERLLIGRNDSLDGSFLDDICIGYKQG